MSLWDAPTRRLVLVAGSLSLVAGLLHLEVAPDHFVEWWGYGLFFVVCFVAQGANGAILLWEAYSTRPRPGWWPSGWRFMLAAGIVGNLILVAFWAYTRFVGVPLGPGAGETEEMGLLDLLTKTVEVALVVALCGLVRYGPRLEENARAPATVS